MVPQLYCAAADAKPEYAVKAAFLLNFTKFVEWPPSVFERSDSPLTVCVLGDDPFGKLLDQVVEGEAVSGHKLLVERIGRSPVPKTCRVLFVSKSEKGTPEILSGLGPGVLTVGDGDTFLREGGAIAFVIEDRRIRFDINLRAATRASLSLSARLLNVARTVQR